MITMSTFDATAATFDLYRAFPEGVAEAIRSVVCTFSKLKPAARVLDVGAGTGRIGKAFVAANDCYFGVDRSHGMLRKFHSCSEEMRCSNLCLIQADGRRLPFPDQIFDVVMFMQIISGVRDWRVLLTEGRRVLRPDGMIVIGHTEMPPDGIDKRLKKRLVEILEDFGAESSHGKKRRDDALVWLGSVARRRVHRTATSWNVTRSPQEFLLRHRTGATFSTLPSQIQEEALKKLSDWAEQMFGSLNATFPEEHTFELDLFEF